MQIIEPQRMYRRSAEERRGDMLRGVWPIGSKLPPERDLAKHLGVSRPSLREALIALEVEGLIEVRTGSGIYVRSITPRPMQSNAIGPNNSRDIPLTWGPLEVMYAREIIEVEIASLAAKNARKSEISDMHKGLALMREASAKGLLTREGDEAFHLAIARACGNDVLIFMVQQAWAARDGELFERLGDYFEHPDSWNKAIQEHEAVLHAIEVHDSKAARRAMQVHLRNATKRYSASWKLPPA